MLSKHEEERERRETLENDRRVREQQKQSEASTFHQHAQAAADDLAGGRFAGVNPSTVVGSEPAVKYPAASPTWQIQLPDEPPLGFDNPALDESSMAASIGETSAPAGATASSEKLPPWRDRSGDAGAPFSSDEPKDRGNDAA
jgi:hypothetical protein